MKLKEIIEFLDEKIPKSLALESDEVGFKKEYDLNQTISSIKIYMDLLPEDDSYTENTLIITHHPPSFIPKTPTYTIHSNWDIIKQVKQSVSIPVSISALPPSEMKWRTLKSWGIFFSRTHRQAGCPPSWATVTMWMTSI